MSDIVHNERTKLLANALDRASTAALAIGVLGPMVTATYGLGPAVAPIPLPALVVGTIFWLGAVLVLHASARWILRRLR